MNEERLAEIEAAAKILQRGSRGIGGWDGGYATVDYHPRIKSDDEMRSLAALTEDLPEIVQELVDEVRSLRAKTKSAPCDDGHDYTIEHPPPGTWGRAIMFCRKCGKFPAATTSTLKGSRNG